MTIPAQVGTCSGIHGRTGASIRYTGAMAYVFDPVILRLGAWVSVLGVLAAGALDAAGWTARPAVVLAVMIVGVWTSSIRTARLPRARSSWEALRPPGVAQSRP